jgi:4-oxalmesaconate hydratase
LDSKVFEKFSKLKIVVPHGGGAIPFQMGRFRAWTSRRKGGESFDAMCRKLHDDTCNYSKEALDFLFRIMGADNCLFGTERPGTGTAFNAEWGHDFDDLKPIIESIEGLSAEDRKKIFEDNAKKLYTTNFNAARHHGHKH